MLTTAAGNLMMQYIAAICSPANLATGYCIISEYLASENTLLTAVDMMDQLPKIIKANKNYARSWVPVPPWTDFTLSLSIDSDITL